MYDLGRWQKDPEVAALLRCCSSVISGTHPVAPARHLDEARLLALARQHRLELLLYKKWVKPRSELFSSGFIAELTEQASRLALRHVQQERAIVALHRSFAGRKVPHVFLKGPVLNDQLFPGELLRQSVDLDILVDTTDLESVDECLQSLDFLPTEQARGWRKKLRLLTRKDQKYVNRKQRVPIDLHWKSALVETLFADRKNFWKEGVAYQPFHGESVPVPTSALNALYLCFHGARHGWSRLRWLVDIDIFMRKYGLEWDEVHALGDSFRIGKSVREARLLSRAFFHGQPAALPRLQRRRISLAFEASPTRSEELQAAFLQGFLFSTLYRQVRFWLVLALGWTARRVGI